MRRTPSREACSNHDNAVLWKGWKKTKKEITVSSCAYSCFHTVSKTSQREQLQAQFFWFNLFYFLPNGTWSDKNSLQGRIWCFYSGFSRPFKIRCHPILPSLVLPYVQSFWGMGGGVFRKGLITMLFFGNLQWMFITFHKQVSVIKTYRSPRSLRSTSPSYLPPRSILCLFPKFLFLSTGSCDILCIFKRLIRVLLCFYPRDYEYRCRRCCCCSRRRYSRKSFYQKRHFFCNEN